MLRYQREFHATSFEIEGRQLALEIDAEFTTITAHPHSHREVFRKIECGEMCSVKLFLPYVPIGTPRTKLTLSKHTRELNEGFVRGVQTFAFK